MKAEFDKFAKEYRTTHSTPLALTGETSDYFAKYKAQKLAEWLPELLGSIPSSILDFGCGDGLMTSYVQQRFSTTALYGCDPSAESIEIAQTKYPTMTFKISGATIPFHDAQFDVIFAAGVLHHIPFEEHEAYLKELNRVLAPGGVFIIFELNPLNPGTRYIFKHAPMDANATMLWPRYAARLLKPYGKPETKFYGFFPHFLRKLRWTERFLTKVPLGGLYATFLKKEHRAVAHR